MQNHNSRPTHAAYEASEAILVAIGGGSMHDSANGLRRIPLPRTPVNKGYVSQRVMERCKCLAPALCFLLLGKAGRGRESRPAIWAPFGASGASGATGYKRQGGADSRGLAPHKRRRSWRKRP